MPHLNLRRCESGVGLIEVIIALFVITIGFFAGAQMQVQSIQYSQESLFRTQAIRLAQSMADRMRANPEGVAAGAYSNTSTSNQYTTASCLSTGCSPAQLANEDLVQWKETLSPGDGITPALPPMIDGSAAKGEISAAVDGVYTIKLSWQALIEGETVDSSYSLKVRP
ncbi:MAG: type IV pilus modification protein PilV [Granulosicoccus sp.]|nr:type IV pilus modification protein PilV [Granulosicoccus sp.]